MYSALLIVSSASAKGMQAVLTDDADRTTAFAWEGSYRTNRTIDQREICVQRRVRFASARLQTCKEISPLSQNYIRLKTGCPIIYPGGISRSRYHPVHASTAWPLSAADASS